MLYASAQAAEFRSDHEELVDSAERLWAAGVTCAGHEAPRAEVVEIRVELVSGLPAGRSEFVESFSMRIGNGSSGMQRTHQELGAVIVENAHEVSQLAHELAHAWARSLSIVDEARTWLLAGCMMRAAGETPGANSAYAKLVMDRDLAFMLPLGEQPPPATAVNDVGDALHRARWDSTVGVYRYLLAVVRTEGMEALFPPDQLEWTWKEASALVERPSVDPALRGLLSADLKEQTEALLSLPVGSSRKSAPVDVP